MVTTIQIDESIKEVLEDLKIHPRETYNDLISRLINGFSSVNVDRESLIATIEVLSDPELMKGIKEALEEEKKGIKGKSFDQLKKELKLNV
jgi:hypothetical protein